MFAYLRGAAIVAAIAYWSPTHERGAALRPGVEPDAADAAGAPASLADALRTGAIAPGRLAELHRAMREAEPIRRALAGSTLADAESPTLPARLGPVRQVYPSFGQAGEPKPATPR